MHGGSVLGHALGSLHLSTQQDGGFHVTVPLFSALACPPHFQPQPLLGIQPPAVAGRDRHSVHHVGTLQMRALISPHHSPDPGMGTPPSPLQSRHAAPSSGRQAAAMRLNHKQNMGGRWDNKGSVVQLLSARPQWRLQFGSCSADVGQAYERGLRS